MFDTPFEQRLRLLNVLFLAVARCGGKPEVKGQEACEISITVDQTTVALPLDRPKVGRRGSGPENSSNGKFETLRLAIVRRYQRQGAMARREAGEALVDIARSYNVSHSTTNRGLSRATSLS